MDSFSRSPRSSRPFLIRQQISDWARQNYRNNSFYKDELIPAREGLLYLVERGAIRLTSTIQNNNSTETAFLGLVAEGQPFDIIVRNPFTIEAYGQVDLTSVIWLHWSDLDNWTDFRREVLEAFFYQYQRQLLFLSVLVQTNTSDRLLNFLKLSIEEHGEQTEQGYCLPFALTHSQIANAIGASRVTVTRLMGQLRRENLIYTHQDHLICVPELFD
jgi:CRP-like cAMP-binding protein